MTEVNQNPEPNLSVWRRYGKTWLAGLYTVATVAIPMWSGDHHFDFAEKMIVGTAVGNVLLVYYVPNKTSFRWAKTLINAILAAIAVMQTILADGGDIATIDANGWMLIIAAGLAVLGVTIAPAASVKQPDPVIIPPGLTTG
jgi:peptidoglycan/LPS O-acetylase OafA/YrhL